MYYKNFSDMPIWQTGIKLLEKIYLLSQNFPIVEKYTLTSQLRRSSNSIIANIAESSGRYYFKNKIRVLYIARGELEETRNHLAVASKLNYITNENYPQHDKSYNLFCKGINSFIINLRNKN